MASRRAFTLIDLVANVFVLAVSAAALLPTLASSRLQARRAENNTRLRGIHQGCVQFAQG